MNKKDFSHTILPHLNRNLVKEIVASCPIQTFEKNTMILREGQYVKLIPVVLEGLIKVYTKYEDKELLLYYIKPDESCIMSFSASLKNNPSPVYATTEERTLAILLPVEKVNIWMQVFPDINALFFQQFNLRYSDLLETIHHVMFNKMDQRLYDYLKEKSALTNCNPLKISHRQIASELGTAREVISRVMKKLESEGKVLQASSTIKIL